MCSFQNTISPYEEFATFPTPQKRALKRGIELEGENDVEKEDLIGDNVGDLGIRGGAVEEEDQSFVYKFMYIHILFIHHVCFVLI